MELQIILIIITTIFAKIFADVSNYKYDTSSNNTVKNLFGALQHIFGLAMISIPFLMGLIHNDNGTALSLYQWFIIVTGYACIYAFLMSTGFNLLLGKHYLYIGFVDPVDKAIRKFFKISNEYSVEYKDIPAKQKQRENFRKFIVFMIRVVLLIIGIELIINLL